MRKSVQIVLSIVLPLVLAVVLAGAGWLWYDANADRSGWMAEGGVYYYADARGNRLTGWQDIDGNRYYFLPDGAMATYWQDIDGGRYYFSGDGTLDTGFWDIGGKRYYFRQDGVMHTGWLDWGDVRYYFDEDGAMATSWREIDGKRYHLGANGAMDTGILRLQGEQYKFLEDGSMFTGWDEQEDAKYYYLPEGALAKRWQEIDGKRYYFGTDGVMRTGWLSHGGNRYYLHEDGSAAHGPTEIGGEVYHFSPTGIHVVLVNEHNPVPDYYTVTLKPVETWNRVSTECYAPLVRMLADCRREGYTLTFNSAYRSIEEQQKILDKRTNEAIDDGMSKEEAYAKARQTVALPGTSEHHLGLAVDLVGEEALVWLREHCWEYGFIVRYQADKADITGIIDEPWHFRYVGTTVAMEMKDSGLCLEEYLGAA